MNNRPQGREKHVTGEGKGVEKRGSGLGTGPVGRQDGYAGRGSSGGSGGSGGGGGGNGGPNRAGGGGISPILIIVILAVLVLGGGGKLLSGLFGGGSGSETATGGALGNIVQNLADPGNTGTGAGGVGGSLLQSLLGGYSGGSTVSNGWVKSANTGKLDTSVASGARSKRTTILGNGQDTVTIMVYMCGTDLESKNGMATADLKEMASATLGKNVNLLVYTGGCKEWKNTAVNSRVNQIYRVRDGGLECLVKDDGSAAMTKPATLARFIKYCKENYPANRNELIFWDHGGGSLSGFGYDEKNAASGSMTLGGIDEALKTAGMTFDFIGFDACLMATLENALMLDNYADYLIASEETEPGVGWYYTNWLTSLSKNTSMPTIEIGKNIVDDFVAFCDQKCNGQKATLSVIDLAELSAKVPEPFKDFASSTSDLLQNKGYKTVSDARSGAREFAVSNKIDQVDLVHLAYNLGTDEGAELAEALLGAVKYNKTSPNMTNAYGVSIYFPYKKTSKVSSAVATYKAIGVDSEYSRCIQQFAGLEVGGQAASGGEASPMTSLFGSLLGGQATSTASSGASSLGGITSILSGLVGGDLGNVAGLTSGNSGFLSQFLDVDRASEYIANNRLDIDALVWTTANGVTGLRLSEEQWSLVHDLELNVFYDDGEGYIDLGLDNVFEFADDGTLLGEYDGTWLAIDGQVVPYYYLDTTYEGDRYTITGRVPVMLNGSRAELLIVFDNKNPYGYIAGARAVYTEGETETVAKGVAELEYGDTIEFICDYYTYSGKYSDSYLFGDPMTYTGDHEISNVYLPDSENAVASYLLTDIYHQEYWTPAIPG